MQAVRLKSFALGAAASAALSLAAFDPAGAVTTYGVPSCAAWGQEAQKPLHRAWLLGYLTAANDVWLALKPNPTGEPLDKVGSADLIYAYMDSFCKANPAETVMTGAQKLFIELERRATAK